MGMTVCEREVGDGHHIRITWSGCQTALPSGALDGSAPRRTRYFFDVLVDDLYYYGNRFLTSPDAEGCKDEYGNPILSRTDLILELCADRVARTIQAGTIDSLPNDLGTIELSEILARTRRTDPLSP